MIDILLKVLAAVAIATFSSWITVHLSRNKFRTERWWEKKFDAYERVIESFHKSKKFYTEHLRSEELNLEMDESRKEELRSQAKVARDEVLRASDIGSFILTSNALNILAKYEAELNNMPRQESWYEHLDMAWSITDRHMKDFIKEAHSELSPGA